MATQINARARDFNFALDVSESCNCCTKSRPICDDTHIYVHSDGRAEKFSVRKARSVSTSLQRNASNIKAVIGALAQLEGVDEEEALEGIRARSGLSLDERRVEEITKRDLDNINEAIKQFFETAGYTEGSSSG